MLRAVPSIIRLACSTSRALRSAIFSLTMFSIWADVTVPTFSLLGTPDPLAMPAACLSSAAAGGLLVTKSNAAVVVDVDHDRNRHAVGFARPLVELRDELPQVDAVAAQRGADRRGRSGLTAGNLELRRSDKLLCHKQSLSLAGSADGVGRAATRLNFFDLPVFQFDGSRAAEDVDHHRHAAVGLVDGVDFAFEILERPLVDLHPIARA